MNRSQEDIKSRKMTLSKKTLNRLNGARKRTDLNLRNEDRQADTFTCGCKSVSYCPK